MGAKKLDLAGPRRQILLAALQYAMSLAVPETRDIYRWTLQRAMESNRNKILLTQAQAGIVAGALYRWQATHGESPASNAMLAQIQMPRRQYNNWLEKQERKV